jgi:hypothetical protein
MLVFRSLGCITNAPTTTSASTTTTTIAEHYFGHCELSALDRIAFVAPWTHEQSFQYTQSLCASWSFSAHEHALIGTESWLVGCVVRVKLRLGLRSASRQCLALGWHRLHRVGVDMFPHTQAKRG